MATGRIGTLNPADRAAFFETSKRLGLDPYEFGALVHQESGFNPNVRGGAGGNYYGLIQFGGPERTEAGLDPSKIGKYSIAEQLPHVEKWMLGRGYKPGMGIAKAYATVLGGNPNVSLSAKDSFGTSVGSSLPRFQPGGELYKRAQGTLGDPIGYANAPTQIPQKIQPESGGNVFIFKQYRNPEGVDPNTMLKNFADAVMSDVLNKKQAVVRPSFDPIALLTNALNPKVNYEEGPVNLV